MCISSAIVKETIRRARESVVDGLVIEGILFWYEGRISAVMAIARHNRNTALMVECSAAINEIRFLHTYTRRHGLMAGVIY